MRKTTCWSFGVDSYDGGDGNDTLFIGGPEDAPASYNIDLELGQDQFGNTFANIENVTTGAGDDNLLGTDADNQFFGNEGDDTLNGGAGDDFLNGGIGDDLLIASEGSNTYFGDSGIDTLQIAGTTVEDRDYQIDLEEGTDNFGSTSFGIENVNAGSGNDSIFGGFFDNNLDGGAGDDTLIGGGGDDTLTGGEGSDIFGVENAAGSIAITDFTQGEDQIDLRGVAQVDEFEDILAVLMQAGSSSTLSFDLENDETLRLEIESEEELDEGDFLF